MSCFYQHQSGLNGGGAKAVFERGERGQGCLLNPRLAVTHVGSYGVKRTRVPVLVLHNLVKLVFSLRGQNKV